MDYTDKAFDIIGKGLPPEEETALLKELLGRVEQQIVNITGEDVLHDCRRDWLSDRVWPGEKESDDDKVGDLLGTRSVILDRLFLLHRTPGEIERFRMLNDYLMKLTTELHKKTADTYRMLLRNIPGDGFTDDVDIEGVLLYDCDCGQDYVRLQEDSFYGSDFPQMLATLSAYENDKVEAIVHCYAGWDPELDRPEMSDVELGVENTLDDENSWEEGFRDMPEFKDIRICHAVHDICTHRQYSIPDLLRMNNFRTEVRIELRKNSEVGGKGCCWWETCSQLDFIDHFMDEAKNRPAGMSLREFVRNRTEEYFRHEWYESREDLRTYRISCEDDARAYLWKVWEGLHDTYEKRKAAREFKRQQRCPQKSEES